MTRQLVQGSSFGTKANLQYASIVNYGAIGDGVTDNTAAFTAALATGAPVYVPPGVYITAPLNLTSGTVIFGAGAISVVKLKTGSNLPFITLNNATGAMLNNFTVDGNKTGNSGSGVHGIMIFGGANNAVDNMWIQNTLGDGVNVTSNATDVMIFDSSITGFVKNGVTVENATRVTISNVLTYTSDNSAFPGDGFAIAPVTSAAVCSDILINGCRARSTVGRGFAVQGLGSQNAFRVIIDACFAEANTSHGFHVITATEVSLCNCIARNGSGDGFRFEGNATYSRVIAGTSDTMIGWGCREVVSGSTPNYNLLGGLILLNNTGSNTVTKVGANSTNPF